MMETIKIGFTGNRYGLSIEQKEQIKLILDNYTNIIVSHGDCVGADTDFHNLCINYRETYPDKSLMIHIFPPNDPKSRAFNKGDLLMGENPYLVRNSAIIKNSSILIGCPIDKNKETLRSGTWSTIRKARKQNLLLYIL
jgi:hypothetical protein